MGVFTKQNLIALPIAARGVAGGRRIGDPRGASRRSGRCSRPPEPPGASSLFGPRFLEQVGASRGYARGKALSMAMQWMPRMLVFLGLGEVLRRRFARDAFVAFAIVYAAVSILVGVGLAGGDGVYWNVDVRRRVGALPDGGAGVQPPRAGDCAECRANPSRDGGGLPGGAGDRRSR